ncbi:MAG TPA: TonB-dependent receptor, partial [Bacteroidales bacterium]|nr:TonB-dependent receptor [Bacteroidales bacterium]
MNNKSNYFLRAVRLVLGAGCWALAVIHGYPQGTLSGTVRDKNTGKPLAGANVVIENTFLSTTSAKDGTYRIPGIRTGTRTLTVSFMGYETLHRTIFFSGDTVMNFEMPVSAILGEEVNIIATRAQPKTPVTYSGMNEKEISQVNLGKDMPYILQNTPSVVVTSDAGTGTGYTGISIRGTDLTRINVTVNGIPLNDAESQGVWFVDLPDLASSTRDVQVQRGVGTSTNGAGAFGATINILTQSLSQDPYGELDASAGSYGTFKTTLRFGTGLLANKIAVDGRASYISSEGYIDRAFSRLASFYLSAGYFGKSTTLKLNILGGTEKTYQAWEGVPKDSLATNRTYNPAGQYTDLNGHIAYYDNQTDNYNQNHYQLIFSQGIGQYFNVNAALHYTKGKGYYENYDTAQAFSAYALPDVIIGPDTITSTNMITQKWLDNDFYGLTFSGNYHLGDRWKVTLGGAWNRYYGKHYGKIIWARYASTGDHERNWYYSTGLKRDFNIYGKISYTFLKHFTLFGDLQYRHIYYDIEGTIDDLRDITQTHLFDFFNPKIGIYYQISDRHSVYFSFAVANREPNRDNYEAADSNHMPAPERLYDFELGYNLKLSRFSAGINLYYMRYHDQLVLTGQINNVGEAIMTNVPESYRAGIELSAGAHIAKWLNWD